MTDRMMKADISPQNGGTGQRGNGAQCGCPENVQGPVRRAAGYTVQQLNMLGPDRIPEEYDTSAHLIYNSPAALAFNSPGAEGFGVKRAGLAVPGSVMLIISPGCCGRNTSGITEIEGYADRFFYLEISGTDLVTGRYLKAVPQAVEEIVDACRVRPSAVMLCVTCVDALLGTDMDRVARKAEERVHIPVRPCYMYALTREGRRPPMTAVRKSIYSMLPVQKRCRSSVNLLGFFAPLDPDSELFALLRAIGVKTVRQIASCRDMKEFQRMGEANFNLVLNPEARDAAEDLEKRLGIGFIELKRFCGSERIGRQYRAFCSVFGADPGGSERVSEAVRSILRKARGGADDAFARLKARYPDLVFSVGETVNADPFELALTLAEEGFRVREIFANPSGQNAWAVSRLAAVSPDTMVYSNMEPMMLYYDLPEGREIPGAVAVGKDAGFYHPDAVRVPWNTDQQPWGFAGRRKLAEAILAACEGKADFPAAQGKASETIPTACEGKADFPAPRGKASEATPAACVEKEYKEKEQESGTCRDAGGVRKAGGTAQ